MRTIHTNFDPRSTVGRGSRRGAAYWALALAAASGVDARELLLVRDGQAQSDRFGHAVAGVGDLDGNGVPDLLVGSPEHFGAGGDASGRVYLYSGGVGSLIRSWEGEAPVDFFGSAVAGAGDVDGDGVGDLIVGAPARDGAGGIAAGSAYAFSGATGALLYRWDGQDGSGMFGASVDGAGDVNADGFHDFIIGAPEHTSPNGRYAGRVYVYSGATGAPLWIGDGEAPNDNFGFDVAGAGDVDADGFADFVVGAVNHSSPGRDGAGRIFVYSGLSGNLLWSEAGEVEGDEFGWSVAGVGDVNGNGSDDIAAGAYGHENGAGKLYVYDGGDGALLWSQAGAESLDRLGITVAAAGDVDGDGRPDVVAGSSGSDGPAGLNTGRAFVFSGRTGAVLWSWAGEQGGEVYGGDGGSQLGETVAGAGDIDGDGRADLVLGAPSHDSVAGADSGRVYVYSGVETLALAAPVPGEAGTVNTFAIEGVRERESVILAASFAQGREEVAGCPGAFASLGSPQVLGSATADTLEQATVEVFVPAEMAGRSVRFQVLSLAECRLSDVVLYDFP